MKFWNSAKFSDNKSVKFGRNVAKNMCFGKSFYGIRQNCVAFFKLAAKIKQTREKSQKKSGMLWVMQHRML